MKGQLRFVQQSFVNALNVFKGENWKVQVTEELLR